MYYTKVYEINYNQQKYGLLVSGNKNGSFVASLIQYSLNGDQINKQGVRFNIVHPWFNYWVENEIYNEAIEWLDANFKDYTIDLIEQIPRYKS